MKGSVNLVFFLFFIASSSLVNSQSDSCASKLTVNHLIPFNTSSLSCFSAWSSQDFILRYSNSGPNLWSFVLSVPDTKSYIAIGFSSDGRMVGSSAIAGWISSSGTGTVKQYYLGGTSSRSCPPDQGNLKLVQDKSLIISQSSRLYLTFQLNTAQPETNLIYAIGPQNDLPSSDNYLPRHQNMASGFINYATGGGGSATSGGNDDGDSDKEDGGSRRSAPKDVGRGGEGGVAAESGGDSWFDLARKHALLVILGWGVLMPVGILVARYFKHCDPHWFYIHIAIQCIGFVLGVLGVITGFNLEDDEGEGEGEGEYDTHKALGICILVFGCLQVMAFLARPGKASKVRKYWNWYHGFVGCATIGLAIGNIYSGLKLAKESSSWNYAYGIFLGIWVVICMVLESASHNKK